LVDNIFIISFACPPTQCQVSTYNEGCSSLPARMVHNPALAGQDDPALARGLWSILPAGQNQPILNPCLSLAS
jgi:hypothetical protein